MADLTSGERLTAKQYNAIAALLTEPSVRKAAEVAKVAERTLYAWLKRPDFSAEYRAARREATSQATARAQQASSGMVNVLVRLAANARSEAVRMGAASKVLDIAIRSVENDDLAARIEALEQAYGSKL